MGKRTRTGGAGIWLKKLNDGRLSVYIDFFPALVIPENLKETRRECLKLFVLAKPKTDAQKEEKKRTLLEADAILQQRKKSMSEGDYTFLNKGKQSSDSFLDFYDKISKEKQSQMYRNSLNYVRAYKGGKMTFKEVDVKFFDGFKKYLQAQNLKTNSIHLYCSNLITVIKMALKADLLVVDILNKLELPKKEQTERGYLTEDEIQKLIDTPCINPLIKAAFLFSCMTGLRVSDCMALKFENILSSDQGYSLKFQAKKTKSYEVLPISNYAFSLLPERRGDKDRVFEGLSYSTYFSNFIKSWIFSAGIKKKISFHSARHSFATLMLTKGMDIFTVSKMLTHKSITTTMIYGKIIDSKKREAANLMDMKPKEK